MRVQCKLCPSWASYCVWLWQRGHMFRTCCTFILILNHNTKASQQHKQVSVSVHLWTINWMFMNRKATCCTGNKSPIKWPKNNNRCTICYLKLEADCCFFNIWFVFKHMSTAVHLKHMQNKVCQSVYTVFCCLLYTRFTTRHTKMPLLSHTVLQLSSPSQFAFLSYLLFYWSVLEDSRSDNQLQPINTKMCFKTWTRCVKNMFVLKMQSEGSVYSSANHHTRLERTASQRVVDQALADLCHKELRQF